LKTRGEQRKGSERKRKKFSPNSGKVGGEGKKAAARLSRKGGGHGWGEGGEKRVLKRGGFVSGEKEGRFLFQ